jgi:transposase
MWTPSTRQQHTRSVSRYQTDLTDREWRVIAPHLPKSCATGRPRETTRSLMADRQRVGRDASPSAAIIDSQSVKTTEAGGPRGYDAGKKVNGRKRHALVDTDGRGLVLEPHPASIQDRDGGRPLLRASRHIFPFIQRVFADSGYAGEKVVKATLIAVEIQAVSFSLTQHGKWTAFQRSGNSDEDRCSESPRTKPDASPPTSPSCRSCCDGHK